jgi:hypothetical protein
MCCSTLSFSIDLTRSLAEESALYSSMAVPSSLYIFLRARSAYGKSRDGYIVGPSGVVQVFGRVVLINKNEKQRLHDDQQEDARDHHNVVD